LQTWEKQLRALAHGSAPFDLIVDSAAGPNVQGYQRLLKAGGRFVSIGATTLDKPVIDIYRLFLQQQVLIGTTMGSPTDWKEMIAFVTSHKLQPVIHEVRPFSQVIDAIASMEKTSNQIGKIVIDIDSGLPSAKL
jgi:D-arabinose 1-dehydrogenase-like Zn-dependent alcohol dehydrogenase